MIAKITTGSDAMGLARYLMGPGKETPHTYRGEYDRLYVGGTVIGGTVTAGADRMRWARDLDRAARANRRVEKPVWHCSLRAAPADRRLSDREWADIGQDVAERMGYAEHPWAMVRHDDDHVHIVVSRVDFEGATWKNSHDRWKVVEAMREIEKNYALTEVASPARAHPQVTTGERRKAQRTGRIPARQVLREVVTAARDSTVGRGRAAFEAELEASGLARVHFRRNESPSTGRMNGYSFHLDGHTDSNGRPVWLSASKISRDLSWSRLHEVLDGPAEEHLAPETHVPRKRMERAKAWRARRAESGHRAYRHRVWAAAGQRLEQQTSKTDTTAQDKWKKTERAFDEQRKGDAEAARARHTASLSQSRPFAEALGEYAAKRGASRNGTGHVPGTRRGMRPGQQRPHRGRGSDYGR